VGDARASTPAGSVPESADAIDPAWLSDALAARHPGARVSSVEVVERHEATNAHARLRVRYEEPAGAPEALFCKLLPQDAGRRAVIARTGMGLREALFYEHLAADIAMRVPAVHVARCSERDGAFVLLIEDLAATGCTVPDGTKGVTPESAEVAMEELAALHLRFIDPARRVAEAAWVPEPMHDPGYAGPMLRHGLDHQRERLAPAYAAVAERYLADADALHALWQRGPTTVIHGDAHIGNLFDDHGHTGFLDWGIISLGTPLRDVSYFLNMALDIEDRRKHERSLIAHYLDVWNAASDETIAFEEAWRTHRIHAAYTVIASCQILTYPEDMSEERQRFGAAFLARAQAAVTDLETVAALQQSGI
jgi:Ser/Thr protein kinase RdoA (MazF antagonist)